MSDVVAADSYTTALAGLRVTRLSEHVGAEVEGLDLSRPVTEAQARDVEAALVEHGVLVFRGQDLPPAMHVDFSGRFGPLHGHVVSRFNLRDHPEVTILSNIVDEKGEKIGADRAGMIWHSDTSFLRRPSLGSLLYGVECPSEGADTEFASMYAAFDALPADWRRDLQDRRGVHDYAWHYATYLTHRKPLTTEEKAKTPPVEHPALRIHPVTRRCAVYLSEGLTRTITGMEEQEGRALAVAVSDFATQPRFVYRHSWSAGDLLFWDNRCTMHRATEFDNRHRRLMRRTTIEGDEPV